MELLTKRKSKWNIKEEKHGTKRTAKWRTKMAVTMEKHGKKRKVISRKKEETGKTN